MFRLPALEAGEESASVTAPDTPGTYYYGACVDEVSDELDTANNCSVAVAVNVGAAPAPDLVVETPTVSESAPEVGARLTLSTSVRNQGNGTSAYNTLRYYRSTDSDITAGDTVFGRDSVPRLNAFGSWGVSIILTAPDTPGTYYYGACVNSVVEESDTTNDCSPGVAVTVLAGNRPPRLTGDVDDKVVKVGDSFTLDISKLFTDPEGDNVGSFGFIYRTDGVLSGTIHSVTGILRLRAVAVGETIVAVDASDGKGPASGSLDLFKVTVVAAFKPGAPTGLMATEVGQSEITLSWTEPSDDGGADITGYRIEVSTDRSNWSDLVADTKSTSTSYSHTGLTAGSTRHYRVSAINSEGAGTASGADSATTRLQPNSAPTAVGTIPDQVIIPGTELALNMSSYFNDPDDDALTYRISSTDPFSKQSVSGSIVKLLLSASDYICDPETVNVTARDPGGLEATQKITLRRVNDPPVASTYTFPSLTIEVGESIRPYVANWFSDTDSCDDRLTHTAESSDTGILTASGSGNNVLIEGKARGSATVTVTGQDGEGLSATLDILVWVLQKPGSPTELVATADGQTLIDLSWKAPSDDGGVPISGYRIEVSTDGSNWSVLVDDTGSTSTSYFHWLKTGLTRHFRVSAINVADRTGEPSNVAQATAGAAPATKPGKLTGLMATADGQTKTDLSWSAPSDDGGADITGYRIEISTNGSSWSNLVADTTSARTSYTHRGLTAGSTRHYRVSAINSEGTGPASDSDSATTDAATKPGKPTGLTATADGQTEIDLSWSGPSDNGGADITGYKIEVSTDGSSWSDLVADTNSTGTSYSHTDLNAGITRHYRVSAINSAGTGPASDSDSATTDSATVQDTTCTVDLVVSPGGSCTYPRRSDEFSVDSAGKGSFLYLTAGDRIVIENSVLNGVTYNFVASKQSDGTRAIAFETRASQPECAGHKSLAHQGRVPRGYAWDKWDKFCPIMAVCPISGGFWIVLPYATGFFKYCPKVSQRSSF